MAAKELTFNDNIFTAGAETGAITIKREIPDIDFIAEHENRVWGIKGNNIYASKLGDFKNWNVFDQLSTDSFATSVGSEGDFTGILKSPNHLAFAKEKCLHKLFGNKPSNFEVGKAIPCAGVQAGSHKSICNVNGTIYYKSNVGIVGYSGGLPTIESVKFGSKKYVSAVAGSDDRKYYCCLFDGSTYSLFVMDTWQGNRWDIEDIINITDFTFMDKDMYALCADGKLYKFNSGTETVEWEAITGLLYETISEKQGNSKVNVLADLEDGSSLSLYVRKDNSDWEFVETFTSSGLQPFLGVIKIDRAHHFQIKFVARGKGKVYALEREFYYGSEV